LFGLRPHTTANTQALPTYSILLEFGISPFGIWNFTNLEFGIFPFWNLEKKYHHCLHKPDSVKPPKTICYHLSAMVITAHLFLPTPEPVFT